MQPLLPQGYQALGSSQMGMPPQHAQGLNQYVAYPQQIQGPAQNIYYASQAMYPPQQAFGSAPAASDPQPVHGAPQAMQPRQSFGFPPSMNNSSTAAHGAHQFMDQPQQTAPMALGGAMSPEMVAWLRANMDFGKFNEFTELCTKSSNSSPAQSPQFTRCPSSTAQLQQFAGPGSQFKNPFDASFGKQSYSVSPHSSPQQVHDAPITPVLPKKHLFPTTPPISKTHAHEAVGTGFLMTPQNSQGPTGGMGSSGNPRDLKNGSPPVIIDLDEVMDDSPLATNLDHDMGISSPIDSVDGRVTVSKGSDSHNVESSASGQMDALDQDLYSDPWIEESISEQFIPAPSSTPVILPQEVVHSLATHTPMPLQEFQLNDSTSLVIAKMNGHNETIQMEKVSKPYRGIVPPPMRSVEVNQQLGILSHFVRQTPRASATSGKDRAAKNSISQSNAHAQPVVASASLSKALTSATESTASYQSLPYLASSEPVNNYTAAPVAHSHTATPVCDSQFSYDPSAGFDFIQTEVAQQAANVGHSNHAVCYTGGIAPMLSAYSGTDVQVAAAEKEVEAKEKAEKQKRKAEHEQRRAEREQRRVEKAKRKADRELKKAKKNKMIAEATANHCSDADDSHICAALEQWAEAQGYGSGCNSDTQSSAEHTSATALVSAPALEGQENTGLAQLPIDASTPIARDQDGADSAQSSYPPVFATAESQAHLPPHLRLVTREEYDAMDLESQYLYGIRQSLPNKGYSPEEIAAFEDPDATDVEDNDD